MNHKNRSNHMIFWGTIFFILLLLGMKVLHRLNVFLITVFFALIGGLHHFQQKRKEVIKAIISEPLYF